ncbi:translocation protein [Rhizobium sp. Leaf384]|uniref:SDR family oxidoreductase n=1 Tax=unclassified Rhizobium TaxID=2613769 RepID=UPI000712CF1B|nr:MULTISPECIES: SDR family oxidoreductase [unclassified Rhizobium]KQS81021.1 translocation protein [Rhizobium sp. Leaf384]KQS86875.1 translocation protein [Rhizobium sp. Leaf383]
MTHVVITGGSSGIGLAVARIYVSRGYRVSLIARGAAALDAAAASLGAEGGGQVRFAAADVADADALAAAIHGCETAYGPCDILVCSAGIVEPASFEHQTAADVDRQIAVNLMGSIHSVRAVYAQMLARGQGRIMLVSSGAGLMGIPGYSAYCASKFALRGFAEALRSEAKPRGIIVSISFPPDTETPQLERERAARPTEAEVIMGQVKPWKAEDVARQMVRALDRGRFEVYFGPTLHALGRIAPLVRPLIDRYFDHRIRSLRR